VAAVWPLVGREQELGRIEELLAGPDAPGLVIAGPAGVGKTYLARTVTEPAGDTALVVRATRAARAPS